MVWYYQLKLVGCPFRVNRSSTLRLLSHFEWEPKHFENTQLSFKWISAQNLTQTFALKFKYIFECQLSQVMNYSIEWVMAKKATHIWFTAVRIVYTSKNQLLELNHKMNFAIFLFCVKRHFMCLWSRQKNKLGAWYTLAWISSWYINILQPYQWLMGTDFTLKSECINSSSN